MPHLAEININVQPVRAECYNATSIVQEDEETIDSFGEDITEVMDALPVQDPSSYNSENTSTQKTMMNFFPTATPEQIEKQKKDASVNMGRAKKTMAGHSWAIKVFDRFQEERGDLPFDSLVFQDVEADNLEHDLVCFLKWLATTKIPQQRDQEKQLAAVSKTQIAGRVKEAFKSKFPKHDAWKTEGQWYNTWLDLFKKDAKREDFDNNTDRQDPKVRPIYRCVQPQQLSTLFRQNHPNATKLKGIDVLDICKSLLLTKHKHNNHLERRAIILTTFLGVGRGGETKFLRYNDCLWDPLLECVELLWRQRKTLEATPMTFVSDYNSFEMDFYHAMGCYLAFEGGMYRGPDEKRLAKFIFPNLHSIQDATVTKKVTDWLREVCDETLKPTTSAKGLRKGSNTLLTMDPKISPDERRIRGCWAPATTADSKSYMDLNPALTLPPARCLSGWPNVRNECKPMRLPRFHNLSDKLLSFHKELYSISPEMDVYNVFLDPFLETCTAALIGYYPKIVAVHGKSSFVVQKMITQLQRACDIDSSTEAHNLLTDWGKAILSDFEQRNTVATDSDHATIESLQQTFNAQWKRIKAIDEKQAEILLALQQDQKRHLEYSSSNDEELLDTSKKPRLKALKSVHEVTRQSSHEVGIVSKQTNKQIRVSDLLWKLYRGSKFKVYVNDLENTPFEEADSKNVGKFKAAMRLVNLVLDDTSKDILLNAGTSDTKIKDTTMEIEKKAMEKMAELEGKSCQRAKPFVVGLGNRFKNWERSQQKKKAPSLLNFFN